MVAPPFCLALGYTLQSAVCGLLSPFHYPMSPASAKEHLLSLISDVNAADAAIYDAKDSLGHSMDTIKIIQAPEGDYLAVYHTLLDAQFHSSVATSNDLRTFTWAAGFGAGTSQPTIFAVDGGSAGYVVAWEQEPANHIAVRYFPDRHHLLTGNATRAFNAPQTLSRCAEGTPSIHAVELHPDIDQSVIHIGGHYFRDCRVDRQQRGTLTNFTTWVADPRPDLDAAIEAWGVAGNIGGRDPLLTSVEDGETRFQLMEGQHTFGDFGSWRVYLHDSSTRTAERVDIATAKGSTAFANPSISRIISPQGREAIVVGLFIPSEGAAEGEAGQLIYYREY
ncbi:hypothetical protein MSAN_01625600 [Mycena sanguinolenta]|uniref:Uncharacterized protein n=1 Tax=Mycena sanguinolenta TaxID=230812 RepID=A0A8H7CWD8_9AGAR|nr:hypothetical protein MSAN_01625600 [Mycena sanguinolenta]